MATREELMRQFMAAQSEVIKSSEEREQRKLSSSTARKPNYGDGIKTINLVIPTNETSRQYKGYFVTDPEDKFLRRIPNIRMVGCNYKVYKTVGLRSMELSSYSDVLDDESKSLIIRFNNLWDTFMSYPEDARLEVTKIQNEKGEWVKDDKLFTKKYNHFDFCYMYLTEGPGIEEPGYYLIQVKAYEFAEEKAKMVKRTVNFMKEMGVDPTDFAVEMSDNTAPKKRLVTFKFSRVGGRYNFDFEAEIQGTPFTLPAEGLAELKPLSEMYISERSIDKEAYKTNINILASWIAKMDSQTKRSEAVATVEAKNDPFAD